jgi:hypothetical protein
MNNRSESSSLGMKILAGVVLLVVAWIVLKLFFGILAGLIGTIIWIAVVGFLAIAAIWAWRTLF